MSSGSMEADLHSLHGKMGQAGVAARLRGPVGVARECKAYPGELARDRVVTPDGQDYIVTTTDDVRQGSGFLTGAYPLKNGYLVLARQPLVEYHSATREEAMEWRRQLTSVLAQAGARIVRARAQLLARKARETREARSAERAAKKANASSESLDLASLN